MLHPAEINLIIERIRGGQTARHLVLGIINGVNTWLFKVLSDYQASENEARIHCLSFGEKVTAYIQNLYDLERYYMTSKKSFREYLMHGNEAAASGVSFIIRSFQSSFHDNYMDFAAAMVALLISTRREEYEFEKFRQDFRGADLRETLFTYYSLNRENLTAMEEPPSGRPALLTELPGKNGRKNKSAFRGFYP